MKSKFKLFGGVGFIIAYALFSFFMVWFSINKIPNDPILEKGGLVLLAFGPLVLAAYEMFRNLNTITILADSIHFKNILLEKSAFKFTELDGFTTKIITTRTGYSYEVIYLKKDSIEIRKISAFYISNYAAIKQNLNVHLKYLGAEPSIF